MILVVGYLILLSSKMNNIKWWNGVLSYTNGINYTASSTFGLTERPYSMTLTALSGVFFMQADWDSSSAASIKSVCIGTTGNAVSGNVRVAFIFIIKN